MRSRIGFVGARTRLRCSSCARPCGSRVLPLLAQIGLAPADREQLVHGRERRHAGRVVVAGVDQRPLDGMGADPGDQQIGGHVVAVGDHLPRPPCAPRSCARQAVCRTPDDPTALPSSVMVSWSSHDTRSGLDRLGDGVEHVELEDRRERQRFGGVGAGQLLAAAVDRPWTPGRSSGRRTWPAQRRRRPRTGSAGVWVVDDEPVDQSGCRRCAIRCPGARRRRSPGAGGRSRADVDAGDGERPVPPQAVHRRCRRSRPGRAWPVCSTPTAPIGQSELSMSMTCLARTPCGVLVLIRTPASPAFAGGVAVGRAAVDQSGDQDGAAASSARPRRLSLGV